MPPPLEHTTPQGGQGFIGIEVKYHESLQVGPAENRDRIGEVAHRAGLFSEGDWPLLSRPPLQQVWFDHLLALAMLQADADRWEGNGLFVFVHPVANQAGYQVISGYEHCLQQSGSFQRITLEEIVAVLRLVDGRGWVDAFHDRYLAYDKLQRARP